MVNVHAAWGGIYFSRVFQGRAIGQPISFWFPGSETFLPTILHSPLRNVCSFLCMISIIQRSIYTMRLVHNLGILLGARPSTFYYARKNIILYINYTKEITELITKYIKK